MKLIRNITLSKKIASLSLAFIIIISIMGAMSISAISSVNSKANELNNERMVPILNLEDVKNDVEYIRSQGNALFQASDDTTKNTIKQNIASKVTETGKILEKYKNNSDFKQVITDYNTFITAKDSFLENAETMQTEKNTQQSGGTPPSGTQNKSDHNEMDTFDSAKTKVNEDLDKIINKQVAAAKQTYNDSKSIFRYAIFETFLIIGIAAGVALVLSFIIIRSIVVPVKKVTSKLKEISESNGDLTQRIGYVSKDEIGTLSDSFDSFIAKLQSIISDVAESTNTISSSTIKLNDAAAASSEALENISNTVVEMSAGTADEAAVSEEITASLAEASKFSEATLVASRNTSNNSKKAKETAELGEVKISEVVASITDIEKSTNEIYSIINDLDDSSKRIGEIIDIITSISEQTNLLALNAAIEAARAGEAGKGFNVVAEEIRKLADESNKAAKEISDLVRENQLKSSSAVNSANEVGNKVAIGVSKASEVGESMKQIIENIQNIVNEIEYIDTANEQQAESTKEMEKAISNVAATSNEIAAGTENISTSLHSQVETMNDIKETAENLANMSQKLNQITSGFVV
ncbi:methyl-accepting chemotaxis protein [Clostridium sp. 19966]|uniref:methyl-accepting chemotaxis protein n=1 Tax=Clostridium sp. 19966 TaxID=2768166 RepID=UPI0028DFE58C|nr:HAMP domain-containing methyl-accepting chemotaxis protein [Clostridium sp. 19966]MDT8719392.1 methyl-accepting chemotaxis protein [Clostridium sp. 19966]